MLTQRVFIPSFCSDPNPLSGISFHPIEGAIYFSSVLAGVCLLPMNLSLYHAWRMALFLAPIGGHLGLGSTRVWPLHMVAHYHYIHHTKVNCNYGGFVLWDWLCGTTYDDWRRREESKAERRRREETKGVGGGAAALSR